LAGKGHRGTRSSVLRGCTRKARCQNVSTPHPNPLSQTFPPLAPRLHPAPQVIKVLPTHLQFGDRLVDERGEWRVAGKPYTSSGGKIVSVRVESVRQPGTTNVQVWGAHERVTVKRDVKPAESPGAGKG
jgi:hypothetical protein